METSNATLKNGFSISQFAIRVLESNHGKIESFPITPAGAICSIPICIFRIAGIRYAWSLLS